jgi:hypothetical protein
LFPHLNFEHLCLEICGGNGILIFFGIGHTRIEFDRAFDRMNVYGTEKYHEQKDDLLPAIVKAAKAGDAQAKVRQEQILKIRRDGRDENPQHLRIFRRVTAENA